MPKSPFLVCLALLLPLLAACEQLGIEGPAQEAAAREAEGRAVGSACRHSGRALEDCYTLNPKAIKAAVFTGWRDMDAYMRENSLEIVQSVVPRADALAKKKKTAEEKPTPEKTEGAAEEKKADTPPPAAPSPTPNKAHSTLPSSSRQV
jgi:hypothetical protein